MKQPKEPKIFKWPRIYYGRSHEKDDDRVRIIYPDVRCSEFYYVSLDVSFGYYWTTPCWYSCLYDSFKNIEAMKKYDKESGLKTIFIGEIKP